MAYENILAQKVISREILQLKLFPIYRSMHHCIPIHSKQSSVSDCYMLEFEVQLD